MRAWTTYDAKGRLLDYKQDLPDEVLLDVPTAARSLGNMCRWGCRYPVFYSVAQHSVLATMLAKKRGITDKIILRSTLLHDHAEAWIGDFITTIKSYWVPKQYIGSERRVEFVDIHDWENRIMGRLYYLHAALYPLPAVVKELDESMAVMEGAVFQPSLENTLWGRAKSPTSRATRALVNFCNEVYDRESAPYTYRGPWSPSYATGRYIKLYNELKGD